MRITSPLPKNAYLAAMKSQMGGHFDFGSERFTGFFLGSCFYVTYHSGYEWNRRYTNQKNAAMGYVKKTDDGCEMRFIRFRGALCPLVFLSVLLLMGLIMPFAMLIHGVWSTEALLTGWGLAFGATVIAAPISTLIECATEKSEEGRRILLSFLLDPSDPYVNLKRIS